MRLVDNRGITDARVNLALEEHVFRHHPVDDDVLLFYVNAPAIIIGRNQNTIEEIDPDVVERQGIRVVRRISGGGAVYHDLGNLNFSVMTPHVHGRFNRYDLFTRPVVDVLRALGVPAELSGRNDLVAGGRKISGNAQFATPARMFSHGTLLVDSDLDAVTAALRPRPGKVESKGVKSIRSRVANIREFVDAPLTVDALRAAILAGIFGTSDVARIPTVPLDADDWAAVAALVERRYGAWSWNYGEDPPCNVQRTRRFATGEVDVRLHVAGGRITAVRLFGDYMGERDVGALEALLVGVPHERAAIARALAGVEVGAFVGGAVGADDLVALLAP